MSIIPSTMTPDIEPTPLPSSGVWDQPDGLLPQPEFADATNKYIDGVEFPPTDLPDEESLTQEFVADHANLPPLRQHLAAPKLETMLAPSTLTMSPPPLSALPKRRATRATPKGSNQRRKSRSRSPKTSPCSPKPWTEADTRLLRDLNDGPESQTRLESHRREACTY